MEPASIKPQLGQFRENSVGVLSNPRDVFQEDEGGLYLSDKSDDFEEKAAALPSQACAVTCKR
jgi:hypothetical protein